MTAEATTVRRALVEVERRINGLLDLVLDPALPQATLRARLAALRQDQVALEIRLRAVQARVKAADTSGPELGTIERACRDILAGSTVAAPEHRRAILCRLLRRAVMYDREIVLHGVLPLEVDESTRTLDHFPAVDLEAGAFTVTLTR